MLAYNTDTVENPWTTDDIVKYETDGSPRDNIIYNPTNNSRIVLCDSNIYQCSIRLENGKYQNFYILAVKRNLFFFLAYIPRMERLKYNDALSEPFIQQILAKFKVYQYCVQSYNGVHKINDSVSIADGSVLGIKVDANIEEFLFPKHKAITNKEILQKMTLMKSICDQAIKEDNALLQACADYINKLNIKERKERLADVQKGMNVLNFIKLASYAMDCVAPGSGLVVRTVARAGKIVGYVVRDCIDEEYK